MDKRIGFGPRFLASLIDFVLVTALGVLLAPIVGGILGGLLGAGAGATAGHQSMVAGGILGMVAGAGLSIALFWVLYFAVEAFTGWTLGKRLLGLSIATADGHAAPRSALMTRYAIKNIGFIVTLLAGITGVAAVNTLGSVLGFVVFIGMFLVLGQARQALHDRVAKTAVYRRADLATAPA